MLDKLIELLIRHGINPFYFFTLICIFFSLSYLKKNKTWKQLTFFEKRINIGTFIVTFVMIVLSILIFIAGSSKK